MSDKKNKAAENVNERAKIVVKYNFRELANQFLNSYELHSNNLTTLMKLLNEPASTLASDKQLNSSLLQNLGVVFKVLLKRGDLTCSKNSNRAKEFRQQYEYTWKWLLTKLENSNKTDASSVLSTCMNLLITEAEHPIKSKNKNIPLKRLRSILNSLISKEISSPPAIEHFRVFAQQYMDLLESTWKLLTEMGTAEQFANSVYALNYLAVINTLNISNAEKIKQEDVKYICLQNASFNYERMRNSLNNIWNMIMSWCDEGLDKIVHQQILIVLLECFLPHLYEPILLTDFLIDSLSHDGPIRLLALQGLFTLIQKHKISYPNIYEKLYMMFEPQIFHTKFKQRLFYLADIFLSSTHLPGNLVAAFIKRTLRLSLIAPPQDIIIILHFVVNLLLRHPNLQRLICASAATEMSNDPYDMNEVIPALSKAIDSSLWEIILLKKHAIPAVANAARLTLVSLPASEFNLGESLETKECNLFEEETTKHNKQVAVSYKRPSGLLLADDCDKFQKRWKLF